MTYAQQPPPDRSRRFLNMSGGVLAAVIAAVIVICCGGTVAVCLLGGFLDASQPEPTVTITTCKIDDSGFLRGGDITFTVRNNATIEKTYRITFVIKDAAGIQVGDDTETVRDLAAGATASQDLTVHLDVKGGQTCHVSKIE